MDKYLIINADDFGMCHSMNVAIEDLLKKGCITSSTIMTPCQWAPEAVKFAKENPEFAIGAHLTTTSEWSLYRWSPVNTENTSSLRDEEGFMWHESDDFEKHADLGETKAEIKAQIERLKSWGFSPSHCDNHMGSLYGIYTGRFELLTTVIDVCAEYGFPFRMMTKINDAQLNNKMLDINVPKDMVESLLGEIDSYAAEKKVALLDYLMPGDWAGDQDKSYENYKEYIYELYRTFDNGITETYIHPSVESDEIKAITGKWNRRVWEYRLFSDPQTKQHIDSLGIKLINYRDLKKMRNY